MVDDKCDICGKLKKDKDKTSIICSDEIGKDGKWISINITCCPEHSQEETDATLKRLYEEVHSSGKDRNDDVSQVKEMIKKGMLK
jgi:hypothetical protein